jgi:glycosyltransferase 2 family protein
MKIDWRGALGIVLSIALLYWAFSGIAFGEVWSTLRGSNLLLWAASSATATAVFPLRARRWKPILDPIAPDLPFGVLWRPTAIGFMITNVVPARAGELARAYALTRETPKVSFAAAIASIAVDRLFDGLVVLSLILVAMLSPAFPAGVHLGGQSATRWATVGVLVMLALMGALYTIVFFPSWLIRAYELLARRVAPRLEARGRVALEAFAAGLSVLRSPRRFVAILGWAIAFWLTNALSFWFGFKAVGISAPFTAALFLQGIIALGVAVPSSPGFFGVFETFGILGLSVYGVGRTEAVSWAIGQHVLSFIPITLIGAWYFVRLGLHLQDIKRAESADEEAAGTEAAGTDAAGPPPRKETTRA